MFTPNVQSCCQSRRFALPLPPVTLSGGLPPESGDALERQSVHTDSGCEQPDEEEEQEGEEEQEEDEEDSDKDFSACDSSDDDDDLRKW